ncbi:MAG: inositol monophosphatase family protein [Gemmatimonadota bacterium]
MAQGRGPLWIVDPIGGTVNYTYGHPQVFVSIAFALDGQVQVGVVHAPFQGETFAAARGAGARLNGEPIRPSDSAELRRALVATGFPYERERREALLPRLRQVLLHCRGIRRAGSVAIDLCWVAAGRLDGFYETLSPWDIAAGRLMVTEAGGGWGTCGRTERPSRRSWTGWSWWRRRREFPGSWWRCRRDVVIARPSGGVARAIRVPAAGPGWRRDQGALDMVPMTPAPCP